MYGILSKISQVVTEPVNFLIDVFVQYPIVVAFLLGVIGAFAPCQLTGNMSALTLYGNRTIQLKDNASHITLFILGKVVVFTVLGLFAWVFGESFEQQIINLFPYFRKAIGPFLIVTSLVLLGLFKLRFLHRLTLKIPQRWRNGKLGSFLLGVSFSIAFCPTMFVLFFFWLMPTVITTSYGFILPAIFGVATSIPLLLLYLFIWLFDAKRLIMKRSMKTASVLQRIAGIILLGIGLIDTITYWEIGV